jgi:hypothetical protein
MENSNGFEMGALNLTPQPEILQLSNELSTELNIPKLLEDHTSNQHTVIQQTEFPLPIKPIPVNKNSNLKPKFIQKMISKKIQQGHQNKTNEIPDKPIKKISELKLKHHKLNTESSHIENKLKNIDKLTPDDLAAGT